MRRRGVVRFWKPLTLDGVSLGAFFERKDAIQALAMCAARLSR
jgi:hypothetical protein